MNQNEVNILRRWQSKLVDVLQPNLYLIANFLYGEGVIEHEDCLRIVSTSDEKRECIKLLLILPNKCSLNKLLEAMRLYTPDHFQSFQKELIQTFPVSMDIVKTPSQSDECKTGGRMIEIFHDKLMGKVLNAEVLEHSKLLRDWMLTLKKTLENSNVPLRERRSIADCCFVVTDTLTVIERTHYADKKSLWMSNLFTYMKELVSDTSNPSQAAIRYHARYGAALALGDKRNLGKEYVETAIQDAIRISKGKDLGNCIFALVNIKLQEYNGDENEKKLILELIENGNDQYANESEELRTKWRQVYLVKKIFCHLGIDIHMNNVAEGKVSEEDVSQTFKCLNELEQYRGKMDKRRYMHYLRGRSKYHLLKNDIEVGIGYLRGAIKEGIAGGFEEEVNTMNKLLNSSFNYSQKDKKPYKEPVENCEVDDMCGSGNNNIAYQRSSREPVENTDRSADMIYQNNNETSDKTFHSSVPIEKLSKALETDLLNSDSSDSLEDAITLKPEMFKEDTPIVETVTRDIAEKLSMEILSPKDENSNME